MSWFQETNSDLHTDTRAQTHIHFPATPGQVEEERHLELPEGLEVVAEALTGELLKGVLVALSRLLHLPLLEEYSEVLVDP